MSAPKKECGGRGLTCQACVDFILDYLDGTLPPAEKTTFEEHLRLCPACAVFLDNYKRTTELARAVGACQEQPPVPKSLIEAILKARKHSHD